MNPIERNATEAELARLRSREQEYVLSKVTAGAKLYVLFCPSCKAPQVTTAEPDENITSACSCCSAIYGVRHESPLAATLCLFEHGIKPKTRT